MENKLYLNKIGFFKEMDLGDENSPSIKDYTSKNNDKVIKEKVYNYLKNGTVIVACFGISKDIFNENKVAGNQSLLTDGKYVWSDELAYYVKEYDLKLEQTFVEYIIKNECKNSISEKDLKNKKVYIDGQQIF